MLLSATTAGKSPARGLRLLPADGRRRGAHVRRGSHPRLVLPPRGPSERGRDPHLPADRPPAAPDLHQGPAQRGPGRHHGAWRSTPTTPTTCVAINAASASTQISGLPFSGPVGGTRVALIDGQWVGFPTHAELERATFDMVVAGRVLDSRRRRDHDGRGRGHREHASSCIAGGATKPDRRGRRRGPRGRQAVHRRAVPRPGRAGRGRRQADRRVPGLPRLPATTSSRPSTPTVAEPLAAGADHRRQAGARGRARPAQGRGQGHARPSSSTAARTRSARPTGR